MVFQPKVLAINCPHGGRDSKSKHSDDLGLTVAMQDLPKDLLNARSLRESVFNMSWKNGVVELLRRDLVEAGIEDENAGGRIIDLRILRRTVITNLAVAGGDPSVGEKLWRQAEIETTMK